jgi:hypothetical protein
MQICVTFEMFTFKKVAVDFKKHLLTHNVSRLGRTNFFPIWKLLKAESQNFLDPVLAKP